ncbi:DUF2442 domain-containing protein [Parasediminibacterium sp. JCM 36343]|uniref:DUF2442 domain-containing protein n=1 Tax=Parasediminibacterium sp. JCM 36343 TaxID=3374279 RepID=UPI00397E3578
MNPRVIKVEYQSPYKLNLSFSNNTIKQFNLLPYLHYPVYKVLQNETFCKKARVWNNTVIWDEMVDFDLDTLYLESEPI